jgi:hypothetical protein
MLLVEIEAGKHIYSISKHCGNRLKPKPFEYLKLIVVKKKAFYMNPDKT